MSKDCEVCQTDEAVVGGEEEVATEETISVGVAEPAAPVEEGAAQTGDQVGN